MTLRFLLSLLPLSNFPGFNPQSQICNPQFLLRPLERALPPGVVVANNEYADEQQHLDQSKHRKAVINHRPWEQENGFDVEDQKQHRHNIEPDGEPITRIADRINAALVRQQLLALKYSPLNQPR